MAERFLTAEGPEPCELVRPEELGPRVDFVGERRTQPVREVWGWCRLPGRRKTGRVADGAEPGADALLASDRLAFIPDDRHSGLGRDHHGHGRERNRQP